MVQEADQYKAEDDAQKEKVTAKNSLESLAFNMKSTVEDEKLQDKISPEDKKTITDKCNEVIAWLDRNQVKETISAASLFRSEDISGILCKFSARQPLLPLLSLVFHRPFVLPPSRLQRRRNTNTSRRSWRKCVTPSSANCTRVLGAWQGGGQRACQGGCQEGCQGASLVVLVVVVPPLVQPSRRWTEPSKSTLNNLRSQHYLKHIPNTCANRCS